MIFDLFEGMRFILFALIVLTAVVVVPLRIISAWPETWRLFKWVFLDKKP